MRGLIGIMPWEIGLFFVILGIILISIGIRQGKIKDIDINKLPLIKPITKIIFGFLEVIYTILKKIIG